MHIDTNYNLKIKMGEANTANAPHVRVCYSKVISKTGLDTNAQAYTPETISKATNTTTEVEILPRVPQGQSFSRLKIHSIQVANRDTVARTVFLYSEDEGATEYYFVSGASVPAGSTLWIAEDGSVGITPEGTSGTLAVGSGGTGGTSFTDGSFIIGNGSSGFQTVGPGTAGQVPVSQGAGADPVMRTLSGDATLSSAGALTLSTYSDFGGRLTLTSGTPVTTADVSAATTIYYTPFRHNRVPIYASGAWTLRTFTERSLALGTVTSGRPYDVFIYDSSGTITLEILAWTSTSARATALTTQDGVYVKSGDATRVYLGTFYTISTTQTAHTKQNRLVWNCYNQVDQEIGLLLTDDTYVYSTAAFAEYDESGGQCRVAVVNGLLENCIDLTWVISNSNSTGNVLTRSGIGYDGTTPVGTIGLLNSSSSNAQSMYARTTHPTAIGYHYYTGVIFSAATITTTWQGDAGSPGAVQSGLAGVWPC